jgi:hypothetical protein
MASSVIEIIDELTQKEVLDLREGMQSGVLAIEDTPMTSDSLDSFVDEITQKKKGERQDFSVVEGSVSWNSFTSNYSDLKIMERYQHHIEALSTAFKVSPSYVGFSFADSGGIGQGASRREARENHVEGVNTILDQMQDRINRDLIDELNEDAKLKFDTTDEDSQKQVEYYANLGEAVSKLKEAGIDVSVEDDTIELPENVEEENKDFSQKPEVIDECVESILEDNSDMSESEAYAICNDQYDVSKDIPDKYLEERDEDFFIPNESVAQNAEKAIEWSEEHEDEIDAFADDGEGLRRARQIAEHNESGEALDIDYWTEINGFQSRHMAQGNHELDSEFEGEPWKDNGYISHLAWGGEEGASQAERVVELVESVENDVELSERQAELVERVEADSLRDAIESLEDNRSRTEAISRCQKILPGKMSQSTYYNWLSKCGIKD